MSSAAGVHVARDAYVAFGGNLGDVEGAFRTAVRGFRMDERCHGVRCSRLFRTAPWGVKDQPEFLNMVARLRWSGTAAQLAQLGFALETQAGRDRKRESRWGPRALDLDVLLVGDEVQSSRELELPHPRMDRRRFVLAPLSDLAPELVPPGWTRTVQQQLERLDDDGPVEAVTDGPWCEE